MKKICLIFTILFVWLQASGQITNTGLPFRVTENTLLSGSDFTSEVSIRNDGTLQLSGDLELSGYSGDGVLSLNGSDQSIDLGISPINLAGLSLDGLGFKTFTNQITVQISLALNAGILRAANNDFRIADGTAVSGGSGESYILGKLVRFGSGSLFFPIGNENTYTPVSLDVGIESVGAGLELVDENPNGVAGRGTLAVSEQRFWSLTGETPNFNAAIVTAPVVNETIAPSIFEAVVVGSATNLYQSYGGSNFTGDLIFGTVSSSEALPIGNFTIGRFFDEQLRVNDSLALLALYEETSGSAWLEAAGWQESLLDEWFGVSIEDKRVAGLGLPANNLRGNISGVSLPELTALRDFDLSGNQISFLANLDDLSNLESGNVSDNLLDFSSLENQAQLDLLNYSPQASVLSDTIWVAELGESLSLDRRVPGQNNQYQWFKDSEGFGGGANGLLPVNDAIVDNEGIFTATVTNTSVPDLTLSTAPIEFLVSSLQRDQRALLALYEATGGPSWQDPSGAPIQGWNEETDISQWSFVNLNSAGVRVQSVNLEGLGLAGEAPGQLRAMTFVTGFDFGNNDLTRIPMLATMPNLTSLDVANNRLQYESLQQNLGIQNFEFSPQRLLVEPGTIKTSQGEPFTFDYELRGQDLTYQWVFNGSGLPGIAGGLLELDSVRFEDMGDYTLVVTDELVRAVDPAFELRTGTQELLATADIAGTVSNTSEQLLDMGDIVVYEVAKEPGLPYDSIGTFSISGGIYNVEDLVLSDYIYIYLGDIEEYAPTYYKSAPTWSEANLLPLRKDTANLDVLAQTAPPARIPGPDNDNSVRGYLELDTDFFPPGTFEDGGRTLARRRVRRSGIALSRLRSVIRSEEEIFDLVAYIVTDENGEFEIPDLPDGEYQIAFEFPGIPMDTTTFTRFELGEGGTVDSNEINLAAEVRPDGIIVELIEETGIYRNYFDGLKIFPVPATTDLSIAYDRLNAEDVKLQLIDLSGAIKLEKDVPAGFDQYFSIDVSGLNPGIYIVSFVDTNKGIKSVKAVKIIIQR